MLISPSILQARENVLLMIPRTKTTTIMNLNSKLKLSRNSLQKAPRESHQYHPNQEVTISRAKDCKLRSKPLEMGRDRTIHTAPLSITIANSNTKRL